MSFYDKLPIDLLVKFHFQILGNIERGNLSEQMYKEIELIQASAKRRKVIFHYKKTVRGSKC